MTDTTPRAAEQAVDITPSLHRIDLFEGYYLEGCHSALAGRVIYRLVQPDSSDFYRVTEEDARAFAAAIARALPSAAGVPAGLVRAYLDALDKWERLYKAWDRRTRSFEVGAAHDAMTQARAALDSALASGAQAGAAGDRPGAAPAGGLPGVEEIAAALYETDDYPAHWNKRLSWSETVSAKGAASIFALTILKPFRERATAIHARLSAVGTGDAGRKPTAVEIAREQDAYRKGYEAARALFASDEETLSVSDSSYRIGFTEGKKAAATDPGARPDTAACKESLHTGEAAARVPNRVAGDLAYCSEIDAALADRHGSSVVEAPARSTAADGLQAAYERGVFDVSATVPAADGLREAAQAVVDEADRQIPNQVSLYLIPSSQIRGIRTALDAAPSADRGEAGGVAYAVTDFDRLEGGMFYDEADALTCADRIAKRPPRQYNPCPLHSGMAADRPLHPAPGAHPVSAPGDADPRGVGAVDWRKVDHEKAQHGPDARWPKRDVLDLWKAHGGEWHGPRVKTVTMPMYLLSAFLEAYTATALAASEADRAALERRVAEARAEAREEAATLIEDMARDSSTWVRGGLWSAIRQRMATEIRALTPGASS